MRENECYLCGTEMNKSYFKRAKIDGDILFIEVCPECYSVFKYGSREDKQDYILRKGLNLKGVKL